MDGIFIFPDGGGSGGASQQSILNRLSSLENETIKRGYYKIVSGTSGTISLTSGITFVQGQFGSSGDSIISQINGSNYPIYNSPTDVSGNPVTSTLNTTTGAWTTSGTYVQSQIAIFFVVTGSQTNIDVFESTNPSYVRVIDIENDLTPGAGISIVTNVVSIPSASVTNSMLAGSITYSKMDSTTSASFASFAISGTAGAGYGEYIAQSSNVSAPSSTGFRWFANSAGSPAWANKNGSDTFVRAFASTNTADRTYTWQDSSYTVAGLNIAQTFTGIQTFAPSVQSSGSNSLAIFTGAAHTNQTASIELTDINFNLARTLQFATGAITTQRASRFQAPTYSFVGSSTITNSATVAISGAPIAGTNATITNSMALAIESGAIGFLDTTYKSALDLLGAGSLRIGQSFTTLYIYPLINLSGGSTNYSITCGSSQSVTLTPGTTQGDGFIISRSISANNTIFKDFKITGTINPSVSGSGSFAGISIEKTINQTSTAVQPISLIDINPTLTSVQGSLYGFRSRINANPTGGGTAWNIYADGTANSYFNHNILIGGTTINGAVTNSATIYNGTAPNAQVTNAFQLHGSSGRAMIYEDADRYIVQAASSTKTTAGAPYTNDGYVSVEINGSTIKLMTTA